MPMRRAVLMIRQAISPRLAIRIRLNMPRSKPPASRAGSGFAAVQRKCQPADAVSPDRSHEHARCATSAADMAGNPCQDEGVDVGGVAHARPIMRQPPL